MAKKNKKTEAPAEELVQEDVMTVDTGAEDTSAEDTSAVEPGAPANDEPGSAPEELVTEAESPAQEEVSPEGESSVGVITRPVNFRTGPRFTNAPIAELKPGTTVTISGSEEGDKGKWYKCVFDGRTGYVKATGISVK